MNISLTPQLEDLVRAKVDSGMYNNASEVVREALRLLDEHERLRAEAFRAAALQGFAQLDRGEGAPFTPALREQLNRNAQRKRREGGKPNPDVCP